METTRIPIPEGIKEQFDRYRQLLQIEGYDLSQFFAAPFNSTDPDFRGAQEQYKIDYMMREHKIPKSLVYNAEGQEQVFAIYWIYPDFECRHENFYVPDAEYNAKYNKVLFPDTAKPEPDPVTETEDVGASS